MKVQYLLLAVASLFLLSCGDDDDCCVLLPEDTILNYDGDNFTAPTLPRGSFRFAIRLPLTTLSRFDGQSIKSVNVYMYEVPYTELHIYSDAAGEPDRLLYSEDVTTQLSPNGWSEVTLSDPYPVDGSSLWVAMDVSIGAFMQSIGCDQGPANPNGDWLYDAADGEFIRFTDRVGDSVNWNIRVVVGE